MAGVITVNLAKPIKAVTIAGSSAVGAAYNNCAQKAAYTDIDPLGLTQDINVQKVAVSQLCSTLKGIVDRLNELYDKVFAEHKEQIAKLSVEIAGKILAQKIEEGDYKIESIVKEAIQSAPNHEDIVVHLNPQDHTLIQQLQQSSDNEQFTGIKFVADTKIAPAECLLETSKGVIESMIEEHLERIAEALKKAV